MDIKIVVIGAGEVGYNLLKVLSKEKFDITVIELDEVFLPGPPVRVTVFDNAFDDESLVVIESSRIDTQWATVPGAVTYLGLFENFFRLELLSVLLGYYHRTAVRTRHGPHTGYSLHRGGTTGAFHCTYGSHNKHLPIIPKE